MASKTTMTTMFNVEKFDGKSNFLLRKMQVTLLLVKEGTHKALLGIEKKPSKMEGDEYNDINFQEKATIILKLKNRKGSRNDLSMRWNSCTHSWNLQIQIQINSNLNLIVLLVRARALPSGYPHQV